MAEGLTFANYDLRQDGIESIYAVGTGDGTGDGVIEEIAAAFGHELTDTPNVDNLGELIGKVGPAKELQENIGRVQEVLGTDEDAVTIARGWVERSGLLVPVQRSYVRDEAFSERVDWAIITGGVRNWMARRAFRLVELNDEVGVTEALLLAGNRPMKTTEGPDVEEGMTEADYMAEVILPNLTASGDARGIPTTLITADTGVGDEVMEKGAKEIARHGFADFDLENDRVAVVSNAGAWVQNAGQFRRAIKMAVDPHYDRDGDRLFAVSDDFQLGTGTEPTSTHQNPFSATGQIVRNAQELVRNIALDWI
jgi:hypothetical protein